MKKILALAVMSFALFNQFVQGATGWNSSYNYIYNGEADIYYDLNGSGQPAGNFNNANLGTYNTSLASGPGSSLFLNSQINAWADGGDSYSNFSLWYRVYSGSASGTFTQISAGSIYNIGGNNWQGLATGANLLVGRANGTYTVETYLSRTHNWSGGSQINYLLTSGNTSSIPSSNYFTATYQVIPEPSTYALLTLAAGGLGAHVIRRRRLRRQ